MKAERKLPGSSQRGGAAAKVKPDKSPRSTRKARRKKNILSGLNALSVIPTFVSFAPFVVLESFGEWCIPANRPPEKLAPMQKI
jgi:hypothetical protein